MLHKNQQFKMKPTQTSSLNRTLAFDILVYLNLNEFNECQPKHQETPSNFAYRLKKLLDNT